MRSTPIIQAATLIAVAVIGRATIAQYQPVAPQQPPYPQLPPQYPQQPQAPTHYGQTPAGQGPYDPAANAAQNDPARPAMSAEDLDTLLAPIALYPDSLLSQVLMASTYPLEVVQAQRFVAGNPNLPPEQMTDALVQQRWDPSVKSLTNFPTVLQMLSDKLDWTVQLGNAFLAQQRDVMDSVQRLRLQAAAAGNLQTNDYQKVQYEQPEEGAPTQAQYVVIENAQPEYVYVPVYDPILIYGPWRYRERPWFWHPHDYVETRGVWWGSRWHEGPGLGYAWGRPDWRKHEVDVDIDRHKNIDIGADRAQIIRDEHINLNDRNGRRVGTWQHDPGHRSGIPYGDRNTAERYGGRAPGRDAHDRDQNRSRTQTPDRDRGDDRKDSPREPARQPPADVRKDDGVNRNNVRDTTRDDADRNVNRNNVRDSDRGNTPRDNPREPQQKDATPPRPARDPKPAEPKAADRRPQSDAPATPRREAPQREAPKRGAPEREAPPREAPPQADRPAPRRREAPAAPEPAAPAPKRNPASTPPPAPAPAPTPTPAPRAPAPPTPAPQAPDRPSNPRATPPAGSGERGNGDGGNGGSGGGKGGAARH